MEDAFAVSVARATAVLRGEVVRMAANRKPVPVHSCLNGRGCYMIRAFFDRLVDFRFVRPTSYGGFNITDVDRELERYGLIKIIEKPQEQGYLLGEAITTAAQFSVEVTEDGEEFIENVDPMELAYSFIRQELLPLLERLMPMLGKEALPVFLTHWSPRVQEIALSCLER